MRKQQATHAMAFQPWAGLPPGEDPFRLLVETIRDYAIFVLDGRGIVRSWNMGAEVIGGYAPHDIIGRHFSVLYTPEDIARHWPQHHLQAAIRMGHHEDQGWRVRKDGTRFLASSLITALHAGDGELFAFAIITRDLTDETRRAAELKRMQDRSSRFWNQAIRDPLTGAFNRRYMIDHLTGAIHRAGDAASTLLLFDIDRFKGINDRFGHARGDLVLTGIVGIARAQLRGSDMLFRLGGDEFVIYLPGADRKSALPIAERLRQAVEHAGLLPGEKVTVSIGLAQRRRREDPERWLATADEALYLAKNRGRNRVA
jgi:diguanylate cyclase (GGDEF)-like protein/PAS domain S-box-containing protein